MNSKILVSPNLTQRQEEILKAIKAQDLKKDHPDVLYFDSEQKLGVAEAKKIREFLSLKPYNSQKKIVAIESAYNLTPEAQNALLKSLEEPPEYSSLIILGIEKESQLLPTILSRCQIESLEFRVQSSELEKFEKDINYLIDSSMDQRFEYIEKLENKEEFLKALTSYYKNELVFQPGVVNLNFAKSVMEAEKWAGENVNLRFILEYLMLNLPYKK